MKKIVFGALVSLLALAPVAEAKPGVKIGLLTCRVDGGAGFIIGSSKDVRCTFKSSHTGRTEHYVGSIGKLGLDIGMTGDTVLGWVVVAPGKLDHGALRGTYQGAGAEATVGGGLGANVLVGGFRHGINLQPVSLQAQTGLNVAAGVESLHLIPIRH